jgi:small subunit ribosomal protein S8
MSMNDTLSNAMSKILNAERVGKKECTLTPISSLIKKVLDILNEEGYLGSYTESEHSSGNYLVVNVLGNINKCGPIKPRHAVMITEYDKFEKRFLPAKNFGILIVSTSKGIMTNAKAKEMKLGGKLLAYCY